MTEDDLTFLPLRVTRIGVGGKRSFDPADKQRLIDACLQSGASLSGLALKAGVNANQLRKWVRPREQSTTPTRDDIAVGSSAFVPVVAIDDPAPLLAASPAARSMPEPERSRLPPRVAPAARLSAQLPNGVTLELECSGHDAALVTAMIAALGALMFRFEADLKVFLHREPIDFRAGINEPYTWLKDTLEKLPSYPVNRVHELLPLAR
jgi:transposase